MLRKLSLLTIALAALACVAPPPAGKDAGPTSAIGQEPEPVAPHYAPVTPQKKFGAIAEGQTTAGNISAIPLVATDDAGGIAVAVTSTAAGSLPTGGATAAKQDTGNTSLASIKTDVDKIPSLGAAAKAAAVPVTMATDQPTINVTEASAASILTDVANIPAKGTATMSGSTPVTLATDDTVALKLTQPTTSAAVTPSDSTVLACAKGLWVGTAGNLSLKLSSDSSAVTWKNVPSGTFVPGSVIRVMAATTAQDIVCLQ